MGIIYLVQPQQLVGTNRYKIGCSKKNNLSRINSYLLGTKYICIMEVNNPIPLETNIKKHFKDNFKLIAGTEYFEGKIKDMLQSFQKLYWENYENDIKINDTNIKLIRTINDENKIENIVINENLIQKSVPIDNKCKVCDKVFKFASRLEKHMKNKKCSQGINPNIESIYACTTCKKIFSRKFSLIRHSKNDKCSQHNKNNETNIIIKKENYENIQVIFPIGNEYTIDINKDDVVKILNSDDPVLSLMLKLKLNNSNINIYSNNIKENIINYLVYDGNEISIINTTLKSFINIYYKNTLKHLNNFIRKFDKYKLKEYDENKDISKSIYQEVKAIIIDTLRKKYKEFITIFINNFKNDKDFKEYVINKYNNNMIKS